MLQTITSRLSLICSHTHHQRKFETGAYSAELSLFNLWTCSTIYVSFLPTAVCLSNIGFTSCSHKQSNSEIVSTFPNLWALGCILLLRGFARTACSFLSKLSWSKQSSTKYRVGSPWRRYRGRTIHSDTVGKFGCAKDHNAPDDITVHSGGPSGEDQYSALTNLPSLTLSWTCILTYR